MLSFQRLWALRDDIPAPFGPNRGPFCNLHLDQNALYVAAI